MTDRAATCSFRSRTLPGWIALAKRSRPPRSCGYGLQYLSDFSPRPASVECPCWWARASNFVLLLIQILYYWLAAPGEAAFLSAF